MSFYGVEKEVQNKGIIHDMKMKFSNRCSGLDVRKMSRCFKYFDQHDTGCIYTDQFEAALKEISIIYRSNEIQILTDYYGTGEPSRVNYRKFLQEFK
jgi:Ca2+-binding EF-hand superfamily protein